MGRFAGKEGRSGVAVGVREDAGLILHVDLRHLEVEGLLEQLAHVDLRHLHFLPQLHVRVPVELHRRVLRHLQAPRQRGRPRPRHRTLVGQRPRVLPPLQPRPSLLLPGLPRLLGRPRRQSLRHQEEGEMWAVDVLLHRDRPRAGEQRCRSELLRVRAVDEDVDCESGGGELLEGSSGGEELDKPAGEREVGECGFLGDELLLAEAVPKLEVRVAPEGLQELLEDRAQALDVALQLAVHVELAQLAQLPHCPLPVLRPPAHVHLLDPEHPAGELEGRRLGLVGGVGDGRRGEEFFHFGRGAEGALELLGDALAGGFADFQQDRVVDLLHLRFLELLEHLDAQFPLGLEGGQHLPHPLTVPVGVAGEPLEDGVPDVVGSELDLSVVHVGVVEGREEAVGRFVAALRVLLVEDGLATLKLARCLLVRQALLEGLHEWQFLDGDRSEALERLLEVHLFVALLVALQAPEPRPQLLQKSHSLLLNWQAIILHFALSFFEIIKRIPLIDVSLLQTGINSTKEKVKARFFTRARQS